jgi:Protein of unknown function (DUF1761)
MLAAILSQVPYLSVFVAAVVAWVFGAIWYTALGGAWAAGHGIIREKPEMPPISTMALSFVCLFVMATMLYGVVFHIGDVSVERAVFSAVMLWIGFVATTITVNYRFPGKPWTLVLIDAGHWLGVMLIMAVVIGLFGA